MEAYFQMVFCGTSDSICSSRRVLLHSLDEVETDPLVMELARGGFDVSPIIAQMQADRQIHHQPAQAVNDDKIIPIDLARRRKAQR